MQHNQIKTILFFSIYFLMSFSVAMAQQFEGMITYHSTFSNSMNGTFTLKEKMAMLNSKNETDIIKLVNDANNGKKVIMLKQEEDTLVIIKNANDMQYRHHHHKQEKGRNRDNGVLVKVMKETKTIQGFKCYKVLATDKNYCGEAWITKEMNFDPVDFFPILKTQRKKMPQVAQALHCSMEGFVMEMTLTHLPTQKINKMSLTVQAQPIDDEVFSVDMKNMKVYTEENVREMIKAAEGHPAKMKKARTLLSQIRVQ